ncbi:MAG: cytochrome c biogenesis protein [Thermoplasmata archaeon]|nr:cytochrome c biogenesis protein [Thermoplasmata archaeon]
MFSVRKTGALATVFAVMAAAIIFGIAGQASAEEIAPAPDFTGTDHLNRTFSLNDSAGKVTIIHVTQLEEPVCIECEEHMREQTRVIAELSGDADVSVITLNVRKNTYSPDGWALAQDWWGVNVTWNWVEDMPPYGISGLYQEYWDVDGNFANPSLIMIDAEQNVVGVYHIYTMNSGEVDGVQSAESLREDVSEILAGEWTVFMGETGTTTYLGVFLLGILSSFSPCSLFMLFAVVSYVISSGKEENATVRKPDWKSGIRIGTAFSVGMILTFAIFGALASYVGVFIESSAMFSLIVGIALLLLGINIIWPLGDAFRRLFSRGGGETCGTEEDGHKRLLKRLEGRNRGLVGLLLGILFTVGWTPCALAMVLPVLVLIISGKVTLLAGIALMCVFALGRAIVVTSFCAATGGMKARIYGKFLTAGKWIQPIFGIAMVALGIIYALRYWGFNLW